jgi:two-component system OmpR family sensor kinase
MKSIRRELFVGLSLGLLLAVIGAAIGTYLRARDEANTLFDHQLREMAASLTGAPFAAATPSTGSGGGSADTLVVQIWDRSGVQVYLSQPQRELPQHAQLGFTTIATGSGDWRVFSTIAGEQVVQVAQPIRARRELAASMALRTILPLLAVIPLLALLVWFTVARGLRPLDRVAAAVGHRSPSALEPIAETGLPREVQPLVHALNGLLGRLEVTLDSQRAFIADAAHELRTPLTAVNLQAQLAERATTDGERRAALGELKLGLERATHLIDQLLTLAREEPGVTDRPPTRVDLAGVARKVIAEEAAHASAQGIDLGLADPRDAEALPPLVDGDAASLRTLLSSLIDNAIRYTPPGGRIDVAVDRDHGDVVLSVRDTGRGIPPTERTRVFDRFYRAGNANDVPGSGLGLAIVKSIADRHGASVVLGAGLPGSADEGLGVTVRFPASRAGSASTLSDAPK